MGTRILLETEPEAIPVMSWWRVCLYLVCFQTLNENELKGDRVINLPSS